MKEQKDRLAWKNKIDFLLSDEYPGLVLIPTVHNVEITKIECIPYVLLNLSKEAIFLRKGEILRHLEKEDITIEEITTETMLQCKDMESEKLSCGDSKKMFIASPVSDDTCKKVKLQDAETLNHRKITIEKSLQKPCYNVRTWSLKN